MSLHPNQVRYFGGGACLAKHGVVSRRLGTYREGGEEHVGTHTRSSVGRGHGVAGDLMASAVDVLRPSYMYRNGDPTNRVLAILLEEQATNLALRSEDFAHATWNKTRSSITSNADAAPDGTATADRLVEDATASNTHYTYQTGLTISPGANCVASVYVKAGSRSWIRLLIADTASGLNSASVYFNVGAGTVGSTAVAGTGALTASGIEYAGRGFYRCWVSGTIDPTSSDTYMMVLLATADNTSSYTGNGSSYVTLWGAQYETGVNQPTSYIQTTTATVTRNRDNFSVSLDVNTGMNLAIYHRWIEREVPAWSAANTRLWHIGAAGDTLPRMILFRLPAGDQYRTLWEPPAGQVHSSLDVSPIFGDLMEGRTLYDASAGTVQLGLAKALGTETLGSVSSAQPAGSQSVFSARTLWINSVGTTTGVGRQGWLATVIATWGASIGFPNAPTMEDFRGFVA